MLKFCPVGATYSALSLRVVLGIIFIAHGGQKVVGLWGGEGLEATILSFQQHLGMPAVIAILVSFTEFVGGIALVFGVLTRPAAVGIFAVMAGAMTIHWPNGLFMNWFMVPEQGHGFEYHLLAMAMALALFFSGGGAFSIDALLGKRQDCETKKNCCS